MIRLLVPWVPPSSNHAYVNLRGRGGRTLSDAGREFKLKTSAHLAQNYPREMTFFKPNHPYFIYMRFHFFELYNKGFETGKAQTRYKTFDGGNRTKLLEDVVKDVGGIDDSQTISSLWTKTLPPTGKDEHTLIWAWDLEVEKSPFDDTIERLVAG